MKFNRSTVSQNLVTERVDVDFRRTFWSSLYSCCIFEEPFKVPDVIRYGRVGGDQADALVQQSN